jgi:hypothetical protein
MDLYCRLLIRGCMIQFGILPAWDPTLLVYFRIARTRFYLERRETSLWGKTCPWPDLMWCFGRLRLKAQLHYWELSRKDAPLGLEVFPNDRAQ